MMKMLSFLGGLLIVLALPLGMAGQAPRWLRPDLEMSSSCAVRTLPKIWFSCRGRTG